MDPSIDPAAGDVDSIDNLDTAKMTLRWALERIHALHAQAGELRRQTEEARAALFARGALAAERAAHSAGREAYYERLEKLLSDYCSGALDLRKLLAREEELAHRSQVLATRQEQLEGEFALRRERLERRIKQIQANVELRETHHSDDITRTLQERREEMDKAYLTRELGIKAAEAQLDRREEALNERAARLETQLEKRRDELRRRAESDERESLKKIADVEAEITTRAHLLDEERARALERERQAWTVEKTEMLTQVRKWEELARENAERITELEAGKADGLRGFLVKAGELEKRTEALEDEVRRREARIEAQRRVLLEGQERRLKEFTELEDALQRRIDEFEAFQIKWERSWRTREDELRLRDREHHGKTLDIDAATAERSRQIEALKRELIDTVREYRERLARSDGTAGTRDEDAHGS